MNEAEDPADAVPHDEDSSDDELDAGPLDDDCLSDDDADPGPELRTALPPRLESWRRRTATGAILTGIGLGLKAALEPERKEDSIVMQASGEPPTDLSVEAELGGILPADNVVRIRPWLLAQSSPDTAGSDTAGPTAVDPHGGGPDTAGSDTAGPDAP